MAYLNGKKILSIDGLIVQGASGGDFDGLIDGTISGDISSNAEEVKNYKFQGCQRITSVYFPECIAVRQNAFYQCSGLKSAVFPKVQHIYQGAFTLCSLLTHLTIGTDFVCALDQNTLPASSSHHITIHVPSNLIASYQAATNWSTLYNNGYITFEAIEE